jgi:ubiquinone/menaquinone biosynthesis C-methylase UbiE
MRRVTDGVEYLDLPIRDRAELAGSLRDLQRVNRFLGGVALSRRALLTLLRHARQTGHADDWPARTVEVLDVGTGGADIPVALLQWAEQRGLRLRVEGVDATAETIEVAREWHVDQHDLHLRVGDGRSLDHPEGSFEIAHCSLVVHHLTPDEVVALLVEMRRVARWGVIVNDLDRHPLHLFFAQLLGRVLTRNRITRHDGPLSVRRAYRPSEVVDLALAAGLREIARIPGFIGHRYALVFVADDASAAPFAANPLT